MKNLLKTLTKLTDTERGDLLVGIAIGAIALPWAIVSVWLLWILGVR